MPVLVRVRHVLVLPGTREQGASRSAAPNIRRDAKTA
jgi:hypothetical protein